jgi:putative endonuclease
MLRWFYRLADRVRHRARLRRWTPDKAIGRRGEDIVHRWLQSQGMVVVARNYTPPGRTSEADLIAWDGEELAIVEVKTRSSGEYGPPERNVGQEKHRKMISAGEHYARRAEVPFEQMRFDVVAVVISRESVEIEHFKGAVRPRQVMARAARARGY